MLRAYELDHMPAAVNAMDETLSTGGGMLHDSCCASLVNVLELALNI